MRHKPTKVSRPECFRLDPPPVRGLGAFLAAILAMFAAAPGLLWSQEKTGSGEARQDEILERLKKLEDQNRALQNQVDQLRKDRPQSPAEAAVGSDKPVLKISGYVDLGFFAPTGDGVGFVNDVNGTQSSQFPGVPWILLGDPWSTAVNSRGEPASTKGSFAIPEDNIGTNGHWSFLVNEINMDLYASLASNASLFVSVDFLPRSGSAGSLGDLIDVDFAYFQWEPFDNVEIQIGKFASAFGYEYRLEESPARVGITPSLIGRYVSGHPIGIKARSQWFDDHLVANVAIINGSSNIETFPFGEELDSNDAKTASGRLSYDFTHLVPGVSNLSLGVSGEIGAQVRQADNGVYQRQWGVDFQFEVGDVEVIAEIIRGKAPGGGESGAPELDFRGGYVQVAVHATDWFTPYVRGEFRKATHVGSNFAYVMNESRLTVGARFDITRSILLKIEYLHNMELGPVPKFQNDIGTVSLVLKF